MAFNNLLRFPSVAVPGNLRLEMMMTQLVEHLTRIEAKLDRLDEFCTSVKKEKEKEKDQKGKMEQKKQHEKAEEHKNEKQQQQRTLSGTHLAGMMDEFFIVDDYSSTFNKENNPSPENDQV